VKHVVPKVQLDGTTVREDLGKLFFYNRSLAEAPEIVDMEKSASKKVFPETFRFFAGEIHTAGLDDIEIRISLKLRVQSGHHMRSFIENPNARQAFHTPHEFAVRRRKICCPATAVPRAPFAGRKISTANVDVRGSSRAIAASINEAREEKLRGGIRPGVGNPGYDKKHDGQNRPECQ
jgi:hypothetical protein